MTYIKAKSTKKTQKIQKTQKKQKKHKKTRFFAIDFKWQNVKKHPKNFKKSKKHKKVTKKNMKNHFFDTIYIRQKYFGPKNRPIFSQKSHFSPFLGHFWCILMAKKSHKNRVFSQKSEKKSKKVKNHKKSLIFDTLYYWENQKNTKKTQKFTKNTKKHKNHKKLVF